MNFMNFLINLIEKNKSSYDKYRKIHKIKKEFSILKEKLCDKRFECNHKDIYPCIDDEGAYSFGVHYGYHTAWAARILAKNMPQKHIDISSDLRFVSLVSAFIPIDFYDFRPIDLSLKGMNSYFADIKKLPFENNSIKSISCMHVVEHIGLTRYGDPFDPRGDIKAINELQRVLSPGGCLLFVVPLGYKAKICFNAHRIYTYDMIIDYFKNIKLVEFSYITDIPSNGKEILIENCTSSNINHDEHGCGCFWYTK